MLRDGSACIGRTVGSFASDGKQVQRGGVADRVIGPDAVPQTHAGIAQVFGGSLGSSGLRLVIVAPENDMAAGKSPRPGTGGGAMAPAVAFR